jgi:hypothetical protein
MTVKEMGPATETWRPFLCQSSASDIRIKNTLPTEYIELNAEVLRYASSGLGGRLTVRFRAGERLGRKHCKTSVFEAAGERSQPG